MSLRRIAGISLGALLTFATFANHANAGGPFSAYVGGNLQTTVGETSITYKQSEATETAPANISALVTMGDHKLDHGGNIGLSYGIGDYGIGIGAELALQKVKMAGQTPSATGGMEANVAALMLVVSLDSNNTLTDDNQIGFVGELKGGAAKIFDMDSNFRASAVRPNGSSFPVTGATTDGETAYVPTIGGRVAIAFKPVESLGFSFGAFVQHYFSPKNVVTGSTISSAVEDKFADNDLSVSIGGTTTIGADLRLTLILGSV